MLPTLIAIVMLLCAALVTRYLGTPGQPPWPTRVLGLAAGFAVATVIAAFQAFVFETDSCVDAGGIVHSSGQCEIETRSDPYVAQLARPAFTFPGVYLLWLVLLVNSFVPAWIVYQLMVRALRRGPRG